MGLGVYGARSELRVGAKSRIEQPARGCLPCRSASTAGEGMQWIGLGASHRREDRRIGSTRMDTRRPAFITRPLPVCYRHDDSTTAGIALL